LVIYRLGGGQSLMAEAPQVAVIGLKALMRDVARLPDSPVMLAALKEAGRRAAEPVAEAARSALPHVSDALADDVRVTSSRTGAAVRMGRKKVPYAGWVEFGGTRQRPHRSQRPFVATGRYLYPAARSLAATSAATYAAGLQRAFDSFGWSNTTTDGARVHD
jgi:hypothetical protein